MNRFFVTFEASASYVTTAPTVQVLVNGSIISSGLITAHTGGGTTMLSFGLDFPSGNYYPATLAFRFTDGSGESRTVSVVNITVNGQAVDTTYISMLSLTQGQSAAVNTAPIDHLFGRVEPTLPDLPTPDIVGTASDDRLTDGAARAVISAAGGNDTVLAGAGDNIVSGGAGNDTIIGGAGNELLSGDADSDYIFGAAGDDLIYGGAGTDVLIGGAGNDIINGGTEDDTLLGDAGNDVLYGEAGADKLLGHAGSDYMYGDAGADWMDGGANDDTMYGGTENDLMSGAGGNDTMFGDDGDDDMDGGAGNDTMTGGIGVDRMTGGNGNDTLNGGDGNDLLLGDAGTDTLNGDNNNDALLGGIAADTLNGGAGNDRLYGHSLSLGEASVAVNSIANLTFNLNTNSFYRHITGAATYAAAKAAAEAATIVIGGITYYGHLVTITSAAENDFVDVLIGANAAWMGASDATSEGAWRWQGGFEDGLNFSQGSVAQNNFYTNWAAGEPNNTGNSDAAVLDVDGDWYDRAATDTVGYVIEWDGINIGDDNAADILNGDAGTDVLLGGGGNDTLSGGGDADQLFGGAGNDTLNGNDGNDYLQDHTGTNSFNGGIGNDVLDSRFLGTGTAPTIGVQTMNGGDGNDFLYGNTANDLLYGDANDDFINGYEGNDTIDGGAGVDTLYGNIGGDTITGGDGNDTIYAVIPSVTLLSVNFNASEDGFTYADNTFGGTGGAYVAGSRNTTDGVNGNGSLQVFFDGTNGTASGTMSGAYTETFNAATDTDNTILSFQFRVIREGTYETNEDTYVYVEFDGVRYGLNGNTHIIKLESDGNDPQFDTGWRQVEINLGTVVSGSHTISFGGLVEGKNAADEDSTIRFDNVTIATEVANDDTFSNNIDGGNNDDTIYGSAGTDTLNGGAGNDTIYSASTTTNTIAGVLAAYSGVVHNATTGSFYLFVNSALTWQAAQNAAVAYQIFGVAGHLAHSNNLTENQYLDTISGATNIWLGGTDGEENGVWRWVGGPNDGQQFWQGAIGGSSYGGQYANWNPGEPNDYNGWESRAEMYDGGGWNDQLEGSTARYVIEWEDSQILVAGNTTTLNGGAGTDNLYGSSGTDIFVFDNMANVDVIHNFDRTDSDKIDISDILTGYDGGDSVADFAIVSDGAGADSYETVMENYKPLMYYRMNDQAGTTMTDHTGTRNGNYENTPTLAQNNDFNGSLGNDSVDFKGGANEEFARVTDNAVFDMNQGTFMAWFRSDSSSATDQMVFTKEGTGNPGRFHLGVDTQSGNIVGTFRINGNTYNVDVDPTSVLGDDINTNTWYHMAFTFGTGGVNIYINGQSVWTGAANFTSIGSNYDFIVGGNNEGGNNDADIDEFFNGLIDEVAVFNNRLTGQSIANIYNAGLNATDGALADGLHVNADGQGGGYTRIADFAGTTTVQDSTIDMLAANNLIVL